VATAQDAGPGGAGRALSAPQLSGAIGTVTSMRRDRAARGVAQCAVIEDVEEKMRPPSGG
jgi:hypothetical protein